jgi:eukaryotic-like serine/threonine-protein kinase
MLPIDKARWQVIEPLLDDLLALPPAQRDARLVHLQAQDPALAADLAKLLALDSRIRKERFLTGQALTTPPPSQPSESTGDVIGAYRLQTVLGMGGMGIVWRAARDDGRYDAAVAVKLVNLALLGPGGAQRFEREGRLLSRLSHPAIARLLDAGNTAAGTPYLVLEYVQGAPIDAWCDMHRLALTARLELFLQVLEAVLHAHANLVLHRDLKPSNILVSTEGQVKLLDFGIAGLLDETSAAALTGDITAAAGRAFSPDHAAPEQVEGGAMTTAVDVYALGVLLYGLLCGAHPTAAPTDTPMQRIRALLETQPMRASDRALRAGADAAACRATTSAQLSRTLCGDLDNILAKALKKAPQERYGTVGVLADDLRRYLRYEPVSAHAHSLGYRWAKFARRNRVPVAAGVFAASALLARRGHRRCACCTGLARQPPSRPPHECAEIANQPGRRPCKAR